MALSDASIRSAKVGEKPYKLHDGGGLLLIVRPSGGKLWRLKYRYLGKEQQLTIGSYPQVSLKDARERRDEARKAIAAGINPAFEKKRAAIAAKVSAANTFKAIADELIEKREREGLNQTTIAKSRWLLSKLGTALGDRPIAEIEAYELLDALKRVEKAGRHETAVRMLSFSGRVFRYAISTTRAKRDVAADLKGALIAPTVKHHAAILDPQELGGLLRAIDGYQGQPATIWALKLAPHVFTRPGELRQAEWVEFDLEAAVWRIPAIRMKMKREHVAPLSRQAVEILKEAQAITGGRRFVFPSVRTNTRPMSENTMNGGLRRLGYSGAEMTSHGVRSTASTLLNETGKWSPDAIEKALAHSDKDTVRAAYHRGTHWQERVKMAQWWSNYLDKLRDGGSVVLLKRAG